MSMNTSSDLSPDLSQDLWYDSPQGTFVLAREKALLQKMLSPWPRRGHSLLEVHCGSGRFLELFWESGFDVTGVEPSLPLLEAARRRMGARAELQAHTAAHLPYDDDTFDFVALGPLPDTARSVHEILCEAVRVAAKGVLLRFWNPCSLAGIWKALPCTDMHRRNGHAPWMGWRDYCAVLRALSPHCTLSTRSTLCGPPPTWRAARACAYFNSLMPPLPLGAVGMLRMEHAARRPLTGIPLRLGPLCLKGSRTATALENSGGE